MVPSTAGGVDVWRVGGQDVSHRSELAAQPLILLN